MSIDITSLMYQTDYQNNQPSQDAFSNVFFPRVTTDISADSVTVAANVPTVVEELSVNLVNKNENDYKKISYSERVENKQHSTAYSIPYRKTIELTPDVTDKPFENMQLFSSELKIRTHNEAVSLILDTISTIDELNLDEDNEKRDIETLGVGRLFVYPAVVRAVAACTNISHRLFIDILKKMYYDTSFGKALNLLKEQGIESNYSINIGAGLEVVKFVEDFPDVVQLSGREFNVNIVENSHPNMANKIVITFGVTNKDDSNTVNPLNFGNTLWTPAPVLHASVKAGDENRITEMLRPRYRLIVSCPIIGLITVK